MEFLEIVFLLFCAHAVADFALQSEFVATNKNRHIRNRFSEEQRSKMEIIWPWLLTFHAFHHGVLVYIVTQRISLAVAEVVVHWLIDFGKCERWYSFHTDQILHLATKLVWAGVIYLSY